MSTALLAWPSAASAQAHRASPRMDGRHVVIFGGFGLRPYYFADPWFQYPLGPWPYPYPYPYAYRYDETASLRLKVTPRDADVYVDGYRAGIVDNFDGIFQRLRVAPGTHEIVLYRQGLKTVHENLYLAPGSSRTITLVMQPLAPGEAQEPPPQPPAQPTPALPAPAPPVGVEPPPAGGVAPANPPPPPPLPPPAEAPRGFGTLAIVVQPPDAEIVIDGSPWAVPAGENHINIELPVGQHSVQISKAGYQTYTETVGIQRGRTLSLNVSLKQG
jgi:PEGA domain